MLRILAMASALCVVLLLGYLAMDRGGETTGISNTVAAVGELIKPQVDTAVDKAGETLKSALNEVKKPAGEALPDEVEETLKELNADTDMEYKLPKEGEVQALHGGFDRQWGVLEEAQGLLTDTGEILK